jgi:hypothetical protein
MWQPYPEAGLRQHDASPLICKIRQRRAPPDVPVPSTGHPRDAALPAVTPTAQHTRPLFLEVFQRALPEALRDKPSYRMTEEPAVLPPARLHRSKYNTHRTSDALAI